MSTQPLSAPLPRYGLLHTGGTFGCVGVPLAPLDAEHFLPLLMQHLPHLHQADWHVWAMPTLIDSSQLTPHDWAPLLTQLLTCYAQGVRQIVVIHGTDTLAYTAAFLAEALAGSDLCVVVTGSQLPFLNAQATQLADPSDAIDNLRTACGVLLRDQAGVYVAFNGEYWPAQTVQKIHSRDLSAFTGHSRAGYPASGYRTLSAQSRQRWIDDALTHLPRWQDALQQQHVSVYYATPQTPVQLARQLQHLLDQPPCGLILLGYGLGNFPDHPLIRQALTHAQQAGVLVILSTQVPYGGTEARYASGDWLGTVGVLPSATLTPAAIYARLMWLGMLHTDRNTRRRRWLACLKA
jgi:L-asparaginase